VLAFWHCVSNPTLNDSPLTDQDMILVKKALVDNTIAGEELLFFLTAPLVISGMIFSFLMEEDWSPWTTMDSKGWLVCLDIFTFTYHITRFGLCFLVELYYLATYCRCHLYGF
jgi:hypothetical protein